MRKQEASARTTLTRLHLFAAVCSTIAGAWSSAWGAETNLGPVDLDFEQAQAGPLPKGWNGQLRGHAIGLDCSTSHHGRCSLRLEGADAANQQTTSVFQALAPIRIVGKQATLSGWLRRDGPDARAALWLGIGHGLGSVHSAQTIVEPGEATEWERFEVTAKVPAGANSIVLSLWFGGLGRVWVDDLQLAIDGVEVARFDEATIARPPRPVPVATLEPLAANRVPTGALPSVPDTWRKDVQRRARPLRSLVSDDFADLQFLKPLLRGRRVVQLGEASHGVAEFDWMKARLVRFLHRELGFDVLAFEGNLGTCDAANADLGHGHPTDAMADCLFSVWATREVADLFEDIDRSVASDRPIVLAGFDDQLSGGRSHRGVERFDRWLAPVEPDLAARVHAHEADLQNDVGSAIGHVDEWTADYAQAAERLESMRLGADVDEADRRDLALAAQEARSRQMLVRQGANAADSMALRDHAMANNLHFLLDTLHPGRKVIVWAHNVHVRRHVDEPGAFKGMGDWVAARRGTEVYTIGLFGGHGVFRTTVPWGALASVPPQRPGTLERFSPMPAGAGASWT